MGQKCPKCSRDEAIIKKGKDSFIDKANTKHNNKYNYDRVKYINSKKHINIICPIHGVFRQTPSEHLRGRGCRTCGNILTYREKYYGKATYLYYIRIKNQYKIGVIRKNNLDFNIDIKKRYNYEFINNYDIEVLNYKLFENGYDAYLMEQRIIFNNRFYIIDKADMILESGYTETFNRDISIL